MSGKVGMRGTEADRFWRKVDKTETCWLWTAGTTGGYGHFRPARSVPVLAHRYTYEQMCGPVAEGMELDHLCRVPRCVNPAHLEPVTHAENVRRGRVATVLAHKEALAPFVRAQREAGETWRSISLDIFDRFGIEVSYETLRLWFAQQVMTPRRLRRAS
jgi:hypothetical protein